MKQDGIIRIDVGQVLKDRAPRLARFIPKRLVGVLERLICQDDLNRMLEENAGKTGAEFCRGVLESLDGRLKPVSLTECLQRNTAGLCLYRTTRLAALTVSR